MREIGLLVEGVLDEAVGRAVADHVGLRISIVYGKRGFGYIRKKIGGFNCLAAGMPIFALADSMDMRESCPPDTLAKLLPRPHANMRFRLAVREVESWLLADVSSLAAYFGVPARVFPSDPDRLANPKRELIHLAGKSKQSEIRCGIVPASRTAAAEGPRYTGLLTSFVRNHWLVANSAKDSPSLHRCLRALETLRAG